MSIPKALAAKEKGNQAFKSGDFPGAIGHYTSAILADKSDPTFYLNRAAAYLKLGKYEDAERDCTSVLTLSKNNVKALFRRGQARVGLDRPLEAQQDFAEVLRIEPTNKAAQDELSSVNALIQKEKAKKAKSPLSPVQSSLSPETTQGKRRRVPIRVVGADGKPFVGSLPAAGSGSAPSTAAVGSTKKTEPATASAPEPMDVDTEVPAKATQPTPTPTPKSALKQKATPSPDTLEAVSSRSLKTPSPAPSAPPKPSAPSAPSAPSLPSQPSTSAKPTPTPAQPQAQSFKAAKEARQTRTSTSASTSRATPTPRAAPAVGGGIFKKNGESVLFKTRGGSSGDAGGGAEGAKAEGAEGEAMEVDETTPNAAATTPPPAKATTPAAPAPTVAANGAGVGAVPTQPMANLALNGGGANADAPVAVGITMPTAPVDKAPTTLFEFVRLWERLGSVEERWGLINMIPPNDFPALVKLSLEPAQLVSIFEVFLSVLQSIPPNSPAQNQHNEEIKTRIKEYLDAFTRIPRFATLLLFLSKREKEVVRGVLESVFGGVDSNGGAGGVWKGVA